MDRDFDVLASLATDLENSRAAADAATTAYLEAATENELLKARLTVANELLVAAYGYEVNDGIEN